jgi:multidrug efflux pump subunit AcrB
MKWFDFSYRNRAPLLFSVALLVIGGVIAYFALPVAIFPELTIPRIETVALSGDTPPDAMMVSVTKPMEQAISSIPRVRRITSTTQRGAAKVTADFDWGTDMIQTLGVVNARLTALKESLPPGATTQSEIMDPSLFPIMGYSLTSPSRSQEELYDLAYYTMRPRLARISGIRDVQVAGNRIPEIRVSLDLARLQANGISAQDVSDALRRTNLITAVGQFDQSYQRHLVLVDDRVQDVNTVANVVVTVKNRVPLRVRDVGQVEMSAVPQNVVIDADGKRAVLINIVRQPASNTVTVADAVHDAMQSLRSELPSDVQLRPFYDQSEIVRESEGSVRDAVIVGAILAGIVQLLFLGNLRSAGVVFLILPISVAGTLLALYPLGRTLNIMTLGAIAIALGLVIDDAVVVVENIFRYLEEGHPRRDAIREAVREIAPAMVGSSATTLVVFLPMLFLTGVTGNFFAPLALTMAIALTLSLFLALFIIPLLAYGLLRAKYHPHAHEVSVPPPIPTKEDQDEWQEKSPLSPPTQPTPPSRMTLVDRTEEGYRKAIRWCLHHRAFVFLAFVPLIVMGALLGRTLPTGFMPAMDEGGFILDYLLPPGTSLAETDRVCAGIGRILLSTPDVSAYSRRTGTELGFTITSQNTGDFSVKLKPRGQRRPIEEVMDEVRGKVETAYPSAEVDFIQILQDLLGDLAGSPEPIEVKLFGEDMNVLAPLAHQVGKIVSSVPGVVDENDGVIESGPDDLVRVDGDLAGQAGLTPEAVAAQVNAALFGEVATTLNKNERQIGIRVSYPTGRYASRQNLGRLPVIAPDGATYPLSALARIVPSPGSTQMDRENLRLLVSVTARTSGTDLGTAIRAIQAKIRGLKLPSGVTVEYGGLYQSQQESFRSLGLMLGIVVMLTLGVLLFYFKTFADAVALLAAGILSLSGVVLALWLTGTPLDLSSFTGSILVIGIVVEGSFFLLDSARQKRETGLEAEEALMEAGGLRLRPILMTKLTAILTLFPLALGIGAGAEMQKPLAIAVIGGVLLSGFFTLFLTPTLYASLSRQTRRGARGLSPALPPSQTQE